MLPLAVDAWALSFAALKGCVVAVVTAAVGLDFYQSLIVAIVSGGLGLVGMVGAAYITHKAAARNLQEIEHVKRKLGANRRADDASGPDECE